MEVRQHISSISEFIVDVSTGWPEPNEVIVHAQAPHHLIGRSSGEFLSLRFYPQAGPSWFGEFELGGIHKPPVAKVFSSLDPRIAIIRADGLLYFVSVETKQITPIMVYPAVQIVEDSYRKRIWVADFSRVTCLSPTGKSIWRSGLLASDDLRILEIREDYCLLEGFLEGETKREILPIRNGEIME
jgi:hypothetical protein